MKKWLDRFNALSDKDKRALTLLAVFLVPVVVYFVILNPSLSYYLEAKEQHTDNRELLTWINQNANQVSTEMTQTKTKTDKPLLELITSSSEKNGLKISRIQPESDTQVRLWLNDQEFNKLVTWLSELAYESGITIASLSVEKTNDPGVVNTQLLLKPSI